MSRPLTLVSLTPREAISDALYRAVIGFDRNDMTMFDSAFADEDVSLEVRDGGEGRKIDSLSALRAGVLGNVGPMVCGPPMNHMHVMMADERLNAGHQSHDQ